MDINKLVESIVKPFLEESHTNMEFDNAVVPAEKPTDIPQQQELDECGILKNLLSISNIPVIQSIANVIPTIKIQKFIDDKSPNVNMAWEERNQMMADKIGYDLIDYIDGDDNPYNVELDDESSFFDVSGQLCEEVSYRRKIRNIIQENVKKNFIDNIKHKFSCILSENITSQVIGGTRDMAPFASLAGYKAFSGDRATKAGYEIVKEIFDDGQVFAVDNVSLQFTGNKVKIFGDSKSELSSNLTTLKESLKEIGDLYLEYIHVGSGERYLNKSNSKENMYSGEIGKGKPGKDRGTPKFNDKEVPSGENEKDKLDGNPNTYINKGYKEIDKKHGSKVDKRVSKVDEWHDHNGHNGDDGSQKQEFFDGGIGKGNNKESNDGTPCMCKQTQLPVKKQDGNRTVAKKPYKSFVNKNGEDEKLKKKVKS